MSAEPGAEHPEQVSDGDGPGPDIGHASGVQIGSGNLQVNFYAEPTWPRNEQQVQSSRSRRGRVEAYLVAAKAAAGIHPYTSHLSGEPSLRKVYVPQGLSAYAPHFSTGTMPGADEAPGPGAGTPTARGQQQELTDAAALMQKLNVLDVLHRHSGVLITGAPGTGKSCLLRHVVGELSDAWLEQGSESCVPVLIRAQALTKNMSFHEAVASAVTAELATLTDDPSLRTLFDDEPFPGVPWLVLVDGIDEVSNPAARSGVLRSIAQRSGDAKYRFLLAGRDLPSLDFDLLEEADFKRFEIQLLTWEESTLLASRWFSATGGPETAARQTERFRTMLERGRTAQLARNPLVATAISVSITKDPGGELPLSRADVYENLVDRLIQEPITSTRFLDNLRSLIPDHAADSRGAVNKVLQQLRPLTQFLADRRRSQTADEPLVEYAQEYPGCRLPAHVGDSLWRRILTEILRRNGCLTQRGSDFAFIHSTVMEYLAACCVKGPLRPWWWIRKIQLSVKAAHGDSYALFVVAVLRRKKIDLTRPVPRILSIRRIVHAQLVAALAGEGEELDQGLTGLAYRRLRDEAMREETTRLDRIFELFGAEDNRVTAAKLLSAFNPEESQAILGSVATRANAAIPEYRIYDLLTSDDIRNPATEAARDRAVNELADLAMNTHLDGYDRIPLVGSILALSPERGTEVIEVMARDPKLDTPNRMRCIALLLQTSPERGMQALTAVSADPYSFPDVRFQAIRRMQQINPVRARESLDQMALSSANSGLIRYLAIRKIFTERPSDATGIVMALLADEETPNFLRIATISLLSAPVAADYLRKLADDTSVAAEWRLIAALRLASEEMGRDFTVIRAFSRDPDVHWRIRLEAGLHYRVIRALGRLNNGALRGINDLLGTDYEC